MKRITSPSQVDLRLQTLRKQRKAVDCLIRALGRYHRARSPLPARTLSEVGRCERRLAS